MSTQGEGNNHDSRGANTSTGKEREEEMHQRQQPVTQAKGVPVITGCNEVFDALPPVVVPLWRLITLELLLYPFSHVVCLLMVAFAPGDAPITSPHNGLLWQHRQRKQAPSNVVRGPFDVFRNHVQAASSSSSPHPRQVSADLILSLLLVFTINGFFLALIDRIKHVMADEAKRRQMESAEELKTGKGTGSQGDCSKKQKLTWQVNCSELLKNAMVSTLVVLSVVIPSCVISQPANQVRAFGPAVVLLSITAGFCLLQVHGGVRSLQAFLSGFQALIILALLILAVEANLFTQWSTLSMPGPGLCADGWFREENSQWPGQAMSLKVEKVLYDAPTKFQHLTVFESDPKGPWGTVMTLDGCIQVTDYDEFVYHEMLAHLPMCVHHNPERVLIIGGGDGGVMREVMRHEAVKQCELVDIDGAVMEQSKRHFPAISRGFSDSRATVRVGDGVAFVEEALEGTYDVVIMDTTDPVGPASEIFGEAFYHNVLRILKPGGICCNQGESIWLDLKLIEKMSDFIRNRVGFASVKYGMIYTPTYPCGSIGTLVCCKEAGIDVTKPRRPVEAMPFAKELKYYDTEIHKAAFVLPRFARHLNLQ